MLLLTITFGGLLLMMGHQSRSEALFYYFRLEDQVPENHLLRQIDRHINFEFIVKGDLERECPHCESFKHAPSHELISR